MNLPANLKYSNDHEWLKMDGDVAYVGITEFAANELGDIIYLDITTVGETLEANEVFGTVEAVKTVSDLMLPVGGEVLEFNEALKDFAGIINTDPYNEGWIVKIKVTNPAEADALMDAAAYEAFIG